MGFRPKGPPTEPQSRFVGRKKEIGEYRQEFDLPKGQAYRLITTIYGDSGVGKTTLLRQFMTYEADRTIYSKVDEVDEPGVDLVKLIRAVADRMCLGDKRVELKAFRDTLTRYDTALDKITKEAPDVPRELADLLFLGMRTVTEIARLPTAGELLKRAQGPATALLDRGFDRVAALHRVTKDRQERELLQDPLRELTHAFVADLNEVAGDRHKVVLMFDTYEKIGLVVDRWLLRYLLGYEEREIDFDLRLVISGREELGARESRWWDDWGDHILSIELDPFTDEEVADFLTRNTGIEPTDEVVKAVRAMTGGFPFWLDLWARGGTRLEGTPSAEHVKSVAERAMKWFPDPKQREWLRKASLYRSFDQEALAVLVGEEQAPEAFAWLTNDRTVTQDAPGGRWKTHDLLRMVMPEYVRQRSAKELAGWYAQLIEHARERLEGLEKSFSDPAEKHESAPWRQAVLDRLFYTLRADEYKMGIDYLCQRFAEALWYGGEFQPQLLETANDATERIGMRAATAKLEKIEEGWLSKDWGSMLDGLHFLARQEALSQQQQGIVQGGLGLVNTMMSDYEWAALHFTKAVELDPSNAVIYFGRGQAYGDLGQLEKAIEDYNRGIELDPHDAMAYYNRGTAYHKLGQRERAFEDFDKAIKIDPNLTVAYNTRGLIYYSLGQPKRAFKDFDKAVEVNPNSAVAYFFRGLAYGSLGQPERAVEDYGKAIELNPKDAMAYNNRGVAYSDLGQSEWAIEDFDKAIELDPNYAVAYNNRGSAYGDLGQYERAIEDFDKAIEIDPTLAAVYSGRGTGYLELGQYERAIEDFDKAIELDPNHAMDYLNRGLIHSELGQYERTVEDYDRAIELDPNLAMAYLGRGTAYRDLGQPERAIEDLDKAVELDPNVALAYSNRGFAYNALGQYERAIEDFDKAIELDPNLDAAYFGRGTAYYKLSQYGQALKDFDKAIELDPNVVVIYLGRGAGYHELGQYERAIEDFDKAIELDPNNGVAYSNRGAAYHKLCQYERAVRDYGKALATGLQYRSVQYKLALALLANGQVNKAIKEYQRGIEISTGQGDFAEPIEDLEELLKRKPDLAEAQEMLKMLREARDQYELEGEEG